MWKKALLKESFLECFLVERDIRFPLYVKTFTFFAIIESDLGSVYWAEVWDKERMSVAIAWI